MPPLECGIIIDGIPEGAIPRKVGLIWGIPAGISEALQSANEEAGRRLSQILDAEGETPTPKPLPGGFYFLPGSKALKQGRTDWESLSLYSIPEGLDEDSNDAEVYLKLEDNICALESRVVRLHQRFGDNLGRRASIRLQAGDMIDRTTLSASLNGRTAEAIVSVVDTATPPMLVQFERSKYSVQPSRRRTVRVLVPESLIDDTGIHHSGRTDHLVLRKRQNSAIIIGSRCRITQSPGQATQFAFNGQQADQGSVDRRVRLA